jgi:hypothetical protein
MTWAGRMRRCASFIAMRLISWTDQRISSRSDAPGSVFLGAASC